jgi:hypothetical protein
MVTSTLRPGMATITMAVMARAKKLLIGITSPGYISGPCPITRITEAADPVRAASTAPACRRKREPLVPSASRLDQLKDHPLVTRKPDYLQFYR